MKIRSTPLFRLSPLALLILSLLPPVSSLAQTSADATDSVLTLGAIDVTSAPTGPLAVRGVLSSVDIVGADIVQNQHTDFSWELFSLAPGVQVTQFKQGTDAGRISFRGFNAEGRINAVKLLIDGIPSNDNAGGMPYLDAVSPLDIEALEIVRGTNDPRYGLHNIAGNANVITRIGGNDGRATFTLGSFGTRELQVAKGIDDGNWSQNYFVGYRNSDGYRDHADAEKLTLAGKWFHTSDDGRWRTGLIARYYRNQALEAGHIDYATAMNAPRTSPPHAATDRSERELGQLSLHVDGELTDTLAWSAKGYVNRYENQRWTRFSAAGVQQERGNDETHVGALTSLTWRPRVDGLHDFALEGGLDVQRQHNQAQRFRTIDRVRTSQFRDWDFDLDTQGAYLQAVIQPTAALKITPAIRIDDINGHFTDRLTGQRLGVHDYGLIRQPKLSATYAFTPQVSAYGNWGRTFQIGTGIDTYRSQSRNLSPSINDGWEIGMKFRPASWLDGRIAYWEQRASGEVARVLGVDGVADSGGLGNVGKTLRKGYDIQVNARPSARTTWWAAYSHQEARIVEPDPSAPATRGKEIENVPHYLVSAGLDYQVNDRLKLSAWGNAQGAYFIDRANTQGRYGQYVTLNLGARYQVTPQMDFQLQIKNLTDRHYVYAWYDSGTSGYAPADGRAVYATLGWNF